MKQKGFMPVFDRRSRLLILGSFPSVLSRKGGFYYGNKQNRFWRTLSFAFDCRLPETNEQKRELVLKHGIALYDIVTECEIEGSMDTAIKDYAVADLSVILGEAKIEKILCNGAKSYEIFCKFYPELVGIAKKMPSTSSANVAFDGSVWQKELCEYKKID